MNGGEKNKMPRVSDLDEYLHAEVVRDGDVITITGKARYVNVEESLFGKPYLEIPIETPGGETKTWTPNKTTLKNLAKQYGDETDLWIGKKIKLTIARQNVRGEMRDVLYGEPFTEQPEQKQVKIQ
jgi:hypothetical protein